MLWCRRLGEGESRACELTALAVGSAGGIEARQGGREGEKKTAGEGAKADGLGLHARGWIQGRRGVDARTEGLGGGTTFERQPPHWR